MVRPFQVLQEIWKASDPKRPLHPYAWKQKRGSALIVMLWILAVPVITGSVLSGILALDTAGYGRGPKVRADAFGVDFADRLTVAERNLETYKDKLRRDTCISAIAQAGSFLCCGTPRS